MVPNLSTLWPLKAGSVVFDAKPVVHIVYSHLKDKYCNNCLKNNEELITCSHCCQMYYCHRKCQQNDWKYHKKECKVLANNKFRPEEVKSSERMLIRLWLIIKSDKTFVKKRHQLSDGSDISLNDVEVKVKELSEDWNRLRDFELICSHFENYEIDYNRKELFHWFGLITTSPIKQEFKSYSSISVRPIGSIRAPKVGIGLYPELYSVSHSCLPNSVVVFDGLCLSLRATKHIDIDKPITRSYVYLGRNKTDRHNSLSHKYLINGCNCLKCVQNLDSNVDYKKLDQLLTSYKREVKLFLTNSSDSRISANELYSKVCEISTIGREAMGNYDPKLTRILINELKLWELNFVCSIPDLICEKLFEHTMVTYGYNHPINKRCLKPKP